MEQMQHPPAGRWRIHNLGRQVASEAIDILCETFHEYPVMTHVLGAEGHYDDRLHSLIGFFVQARILRDELVLGIWDGEKLAATALVSFPGREAPDELASLRRRVWRELGEGAQFRYESLGNAIADFDVGKPHVHLNMIGVRESHTGRGLARALLEHVHDLSRRTPDSCGVTLTTELPANISLYEHFGYRVVGRAVVADGLESWGFFRPDDGPE